MKLHLTTEERHSPVWARLREMLEARLAAHRVANDADLSPEKTADLRGRIAELKVLLALDKDGPQDVEPHIES